MKKSRLKMITAVATIVAAVSFVSWSWFNSHDGSSHLLMVDQTNGTVYLDEMLGEDGLFSVSYTHSVNKSEVEEYYRWDGQRITLIKARYNHFGAGVATELAPNEQLYYDEDGFMIIDHMQVPIENLAYRVGTISDHVLHIGQQTWHLNQLAEACKGVVFRVQ